MSSLLEDLKSARERANKKNCLVCDWLGTLKDEQQVSSSIRAWIEDDLPQVILLETLQDHGLKAKRTTLRCHIQQCVLGRESCR